MSDAVYGKVLADVSSECCPATVDRKRRNSIYEKQCQGGYRSEARLIQNFRKAALVSLGRKVYMIRRMLIGVAYCCFLRQ